MDQGWSQLACVAGGLRFWEENEKPPVFIFLSAPKIADRQQHKLDLNVQVL